jgi:hypothetical protein
VTQSVAIDQSLGCVLRWGVLVAGSICIGLSNVAAIEGTAHGVKSNISFPVFAGEKLDIGYNGTEPVALDVEASEGTNVQLWLLDNVNAGQSINVPVLSGAKSEYSELFSLLGE